MSRTYRRTKEKFRHRRWDDLDWYLTKTEWVDVYCPFKDKAFTYARRVDTKIDPKSDEGKKIIAKYKSDAGTHKFKEPGPMWFVREFTQVPYRNRAKQEIHKFLKNEEHEVIIESMPHLDYWT